MIREASIHDAARLVEIYGYYVRETAISFEYEAPSVEEFQRRMERIKARYPYLVLEAEGTVVGYAYAGLFKARAAYDWSCELPYTSTGAVGGGASAGRSIRPSRKG